ncbi:MAG: precorrin-4 C(11)-methyltransferase [Deltaproteobacteria bacterium]|nr:precorrin-4 C(11)-methyltransferase [Deltaproteobacteria bacterium]
MVYFVGAGPGDKELITVKGARLLKEAGVVVYAGSLVSEAMLEYCGKDVKAYNSASLHLDEIMEIMINNVASGLTVVRLHTGDPSLYGALREQTAILEARAIPYKIVPGVSSAFASAAALKRELTSPGGTQTVIFTRLAGRTPVPEKEALASLAVHNATICVFLSVASVGAVVEELKKGYADDTPAAIVYRASWKDELVITGTLATIAEKAIMAGIQKHALIIVGSSIGDATQASMLYDKTFSHEFRKKTLT